jgi:hypothetical protein
MRYAELLSAAGIVAGVSTVLAADPAPVISNNPPGGVAFAVIKSNDGALDAVVAVSTGENGEGVRVVMNINGNHALTGGPFSTFFLLSLHKRDHTLTIALQCTTYTRKL